jgi:hypothetical protein
MTRQIAFGAVTPLQFGSYIVCQIIVIEEGVVVKDTSISFDAYGFSCVYDAVNVNNVQLHFGSENSFNLSNQFDLYVFSGSNYSNPKDLLVAYIPEIMQYTA